jgi:hypothetical protein
VVASAIHPSPARDELLSTKYFLYRCSIINNRGVRCPGTCTGVAYERDTDVFAKVARRHIFETYPRGNFRKCKTYHLMTGLLAGVPYALGPEGIQNYVNQSKRNLSPTHFLALRINVVKRKQITTT